MVPEPTRPVDRRRLLAAIGAGSALTIAGCLGEEETDAETDDGPREEDESEGEADDGDEDEAAELTSLEPGPDGQSLSEEDLASLVADFDDQPMNDDQHEIEGEDRSYTPRHVWKWVSDETLIGLHFDEPNPEEATALDYITIGKKGCSPKRVSLTRSLRTSTSTPPTAGRPDTAARRATKGTG